MNTWQIDPTLPQVTLIDCVLFSQKYRTTLGREKIPGVELLNKGEERNMRRKYFKVWITCDQLATAWMLDQLLQDAVLQESGEGGE